MKEAFLRSARGSVGALGRVVTWAFFASATLGLAGGCRAVADYDLMPAIDGSMPAIDGSMPAIDGSIHDGVALETIPSDAARESSADTTDDLTQDVTSDSPSIPDGPQNVDGSLVPDIAPSWKTVFSLKSGGKVTCPKEWFSHTAIMDGCTGVSDAVRGSSKGKGFDRTHVIHTAHAYKEVRIWVLGYQYGSPDAFHVRALTEPAFGLDKIYVDGMSIKRVTKKPPMTWSHVFTFAAGLFMNDISSSSCPTKNGTDAPHFLADRWVCDSGNTSSSYQATWHTNNPLWSNNTATGDGTTSFTPVPGGIGYYTVKLRGKTTDDLEIHLMQDDSNEFILLTDLEIAVR